MGNPLTKINNVSMLKKAYDLYHWLWTHHLRALSVVIWKLTYLMFSSCIPPTTILGKGVNFAHTMGIVIHQNTTVGENTMIYQNVTIGRRGEDIEEAPSIGCNCLIGAGACILGAIHIGDNVKIGANAVVIYDVPDNCTVAGVPARIISANNRC